MLRPYDAPRIIYGVTFGYVETECRYKRFIHGHSAVLRCRVTAFRGRKMTRARDRGNLHNVGADVLQGALPRDRRSGEVCYAKLAGNQILGEFP